VGGSGSVIYARKRWVEVVTVVLVMWLDTGWEGDSGEVLVWRSGGGSKVATSLTEGEEM